MPSDIQLWMGVASLDGVDITLEPMRVLVRVLCILTIASTAFAGETEVKQACKGADSGSYATYNKCSAALYKQADGELNQVFAAVTASAQAHPSSKQVVPSLRASQQAWLTYRERTCELASWVEGYAGAPAKRSSCMTELARRRIKELEELRQCIK